MATPSWTLQASGDDKTFEGAQDVEIAGDGAVYVAGGIVSAGNDVDASLLKIRNGVAVWAQPKTYDSPFNGPDWATDMALGPGDVIYLAGGSEGANGQLDVLLLKYSKAGKRLWARRYDGPGHGGDLAAGVGVDALGNVTVAAASTGAGTKSDCAVVSWSSSGVRRWTWRYDGPTHGDDIPSDMLVAADGSVYVTAQLDVYQPAAKPVALTARLSATGRKLWARSYSGPNSLGAVAEAMVPRPGGGIYLAGWAVTPGNGRDGLVVRYAPKGDARSSPSTAAPAAPATRGSATSPWPRPGRWSPWARMTAIPAWRPTPSPAASAAASPSPAWVATGSPPWRPTPSAAITPPAG